MIAQMQERYYCRICIKIKLLRKIGGSHGKSNRSELYKISKNENYDEDVYCVEIKETECYINIFKEELDELVELLKKAKDIL